MGESINEEIILKVSSLQIYAIILLIVSFFILCILNYLASVKTTEFHYALQLLLHFQPSVILQVPIISHLLAGNFKILSSLQARNSDFFSKIIEMLPEGLIVVDYEGKVFSMNKSSLSILHPSSKFETVHDFLNWSNFGGSAHSLLDCDSDCVIAKLGADEFVEIRKKTLYQFLVFFIRNITKSVRYTKLINEELEKSNMLLKAVLPPSLVERFLGGEHNISFAVSCATILFLDIVSFTPWCGSNTAQTVMTILNLMFLYFDEELIKGATLFRVKCIGDCYVAAGGIFQEPNDPVKHANEMVQFGLDAIKCIRRINKEKGSKIQIRVGINTGGPIVAGVIGVGKPSFEILGSPIVMAQQMEQNGVPMKVHISSSTYELIDSVIFRVKDRGNIETKSGPVHTYLVS